MTEPYFPLPVRAFSAIGFDSRKGQPLEGKQRLEGYGVLRACRRGFKIGPLFADDPHIAGTLFQGLASRVISRLGLTRALMTICSRCAFPLANF